MTEHAFIMTQSLTKDMNGKQDLFRPGAVRALCSITDPTTSQPAKIPRHLRENDECKITMQKSFLVAFHCTVFKTVSYAVLLSK